MNSFGAVLFFLSWGKTTDLKSIVREVSSV